MTTWPLWTLLALVSLDSAARADTDVEPSVMPAVGRAEVLSIQGSRRGVTEDYLVLPSGGELTAQMRFITAEPLSAFGEDSAKLRFSDLALFGLSGRWSLLRKLEVAAQVDLLAKQPSHTDEKPWQSVGVALRTPLGQRTALALSGSGGHLIDHAGMWTKQAIALQWRKPIADMLTFDLSGAVDGVGLRAPGSSSAFVAEVAGSASALVHVERVWGAWVGLGYAVPVVARGSDPTTGLAVDPQPRLDFRIGTVWSVVKEWDLYAEFAVVDRGDMADPATRLPMLDGGFDQQQVIFGVTRHIEGKPRRNRDDAMIIGAR